MFLILYKCFILIHISTARCDTILNAISDELLFCNKEHKELLRQLVPFWVLFAQGSSTILGTFCTEKQYHFGCLLHREAVPVAQGSSTILGTLHREAVPFWVLVAQGSSTILGTCCTGKQHHFGYLLHREAVPFWVPVAQGSSTILGTCCTGKQCHFGYLLHREAVPFWVLVAQGSSTGREDPAQKTSKLLLLAQT